MAHMDLMDFFTLVRSGRTCNAGTAGWVPKLSAQRQRQRSKLICTKYVYRVSVLANRIIPTSHVCMLPRAGEVSPREKAKVHVRACSHRRHLDPSLVPASHAQAFLNSSPSLPLLITYLVWNLPQLLVHLQHNISQITAAWRNSPIWAGTMRGLTHLIQAFSKIQASCGTASP